MFQEQQFFMRMTITDDRETHLAAELVLPAAPIEALLP
jgi:hypothetical protein